MNRYSLAVLDFIIGVFAFYSAFYIRFDGQIPEVFLSVFNKFWLLYALIKITTFYFLGVYKRIWRYAGIRDLLVVVNSVSVSILVLITLGYYLRETVPRSVYILTWMLDMIMAGGIRVVPKIYYERSLKLVPRDAKHLLVIGAGDAGVLVVKELQRQALASLIPIGFIDDDTAKQNIKIMGIPVLGTRAELEQVIKENDIQQVLIAMPSAPGKVIREIVEKCRALRVPVRTLPRMYDIINGQISVDLIREVKLEDLLGREPVKLDMERIAETIRHKRVLVTGAGGSIGSELCRQICRYDPKEIALLGHDENPIFEIELELRSKYPNLKIYSIIADVKDKNRIIQIFSEKRPEIVFHAAAHKHVPLMEYSPGEAFKNNIIGTKNVAEASDRLSVETFVLISTDKAVNPTSVMGATKRIAEIIIQYMAEMSKTKFVAVRFGNVLGSRGSVIPIFQEQIRQGGPITVTHPEMRRYFMTIPEAVQLVLQAASMAQGGEIFVLDMGEPVKIVDMAKELIRLSGLEPEKDIAIQFTGIRPGEKLYEELLTSEEDTTATKHKRIFIAKKQNVNKYELDRLFTDLSRQQYPNDREIIFQWLARLEKENDKEYKVSVS
ncbi:NAD-dependent epimerase/dehydratase family protein [Thermanaerosceptrum fracticalcis]|uniref:NAD-dependent epimerase/dehydratase family protein n=1 Tax=Thermanaerosceptrum fracticalcis TaxID=1712410 RepID=A0A7G6E4J3_THEFR|nr:nucleoside-diphosphate sugar epimerase/dehydratase [Thermanaerosceptrum fracticalcis]QNB46997.1 NAD-dependent epimerase/dehydratase family protein [Thermanaerosceptrum fracticalcis]